ncbi:unnamed protein product [Nesidiocoris tenuis]|uniref:Uncharacterized protein n=1 Tax=Nesidiocoris tenuis TaxID=355587 RepID=A0A6H5H7L7_9HEMI|nr:unnamed protein product [Nesidiocoris tenuis]
MCSLHVKVNLFLTLMPTWHGCTVRRQSSGEWVYQDFIDHSDGGILKKRIEGQSHQKCWTQSY